MNKQTHRTLTVTGISGGAHRIGETLTQKVNGEIKNARVVGIATESDFLVHHPEYATFPSLLFENYYWIEKTDEGEPITA